ncbi:MAG: hypothetical protein D6760_12815 [Deltaproteobacteria bacterium]|nr:MAG: hypothetical protein D6760_12815 [Deltaproteobacteria bacterium]
MPRPGDRSRRPLSATIGERLSVIPASSIQTPLSASRRAISARADTAVLFVVALAVATTGIGWGLPAGNQTWAADAIRPAAPLAVVWRLLHEPWNSGWFWFKYPLGHVLILAAAYAPYIGWIWLSGQLAHPVPEYPFGLSDPVAAMTALALIGRLVTAIMAAASVVLVREIARPVAGRRGSLVAAVCVAFVYPLVFYAHTTNVEVPYLFWMLLALLAAVRIGSGDERRRWWVLLGVGAAMSFSTKEIGAGAFAGMALALASLQLVRRRDWAWWFAGVAFAAAAVALTLIVANAVPINPAGFVNRLRFLTHTLPVEVAKQYAPYYFPIELGGNQGWSGEVAQLRTTAAHVVASIGWPLAALVPVGLVVAARRSGAWMLVTLLTGALFYFFGARPMLSLSIRYVLPLAVIAATYGGIGLAALFSARRWQAATRLLAAIALVYTVAYGWDVVRMLRNDPRYEAERWFAGHARPGAVVEVYQRPTYLPRLGAPLEVRNVPFEERTSEGLRSRRPDYVVLSSAGIAGVYVKYREDWLAGGEPGPEWEPNQVSPAGQVMNYRRKANARFLADLREGRLGYAETAKFAFQPWIDRPLIRSLNPTIIVYEARRSAGLH